MRGKIHINSLFVKIFSTVAIGIGVLSIALSTLNLFISKEVFVESFAESQEKTFSQIDNEFYDFFSVVTGIVSKADTSWAVREYLSGKEISPQEEMKAIYYMQKHLEETRLDEQSDLGVMLLGRNGKSYLLNSSRREVSVKSILEGHVAQTVMKNPGKLICEYEEHGYTDNQKNSPVIIMAKNLRDIGEDESIGMIFISIKASDFQKMYDYFTSETNDIVILNQDNEIISSNNPKYMGEEKEKNLEAALKKAETYMEQRIQGTNFHMIGIIDPESAFLQRYDIRSNVFLTLGITCLIGIAIFFWIRQQTRPLSKLADKMRLVQEGNMEEFVEVEGTEEIQELSKTYNTMLEKINQHIDERMKIQEEKRKAEIHALQMQINPHYMYNTLASIKWLIWQGDTAKSTKVIDAFISLLRNTISNTDEFVTIEQEVENLKNYVLINQIRYGDAVGVEFYMMEQCKGYKIPKLILQPFVENAFFHAFPAGMSGEISVFIKEEKQYLRFDIADNGVGMDAEQLYALRMKTNKKSEHFTGIGIENVDDRIKLIYGMDYGINIVSEKDKGTTITIRLPRKE